MRALFKKLLKLFTRKEDRATKLYRGIVSLDQQVLEIRTVVTRVMSLANVKISEKFSEGNFISSGRWTVGIEMGQQILKYHPCAGNAVTLFCSHAGGYHQPSSVYVDVIRGELSDFVDMMHERLPMYYELRPFFYEVDK